MRQLTCLEDILHHVKTCHACRLSKSRSEKASGLLQAVEVSENSWECVNMDFVTGLPKSVSGLDAILVMVDKRTKMAHFAACKTTCDAEQSAQLCVQSIVRLHGMPLKILTDEGPQSTSKFTEAVLRIMGTRQALLTAYHPQTEGQTKRMNAIKEDMLRHYVSAARNEWDHHLDMAEFVVNSAEHESTHKSPFELNYGFLPRTPTSLGVSAVPTANAFVNLVSKLLNGSKDCYAQCIHPDVALLRRDSQNLSKSRTELGFC